MFSLRTLVVATLLAVSLAPAAAAHATQPVPGTEYKITWGLLDEPGTTWMKNGLDLAVRNNETNGGIPGAHETLNATLIYLDEELKLALEPQHGREHEGRYTFEHPVTLTRAGLYSLRLEGTLNGTAIDITIPAAHPYTAIEESFFPEAPSPFSAEGGAGTAALEQQIAALEARLAALEAQADTQSGTPAAVVDDAASETPGFGLGLALGALGAVALALAFRRRA